MPTYSEAFTFRDAKGNVARVSMFVSQATQALAAASLLTVATELIELSNAVLVNAKGPYTTPPAATGYGTSAEFDTCEDKAVMTFVTATGALHRYQVPAPKSALFLADLETIDPANAEITDFTAAVVAQQICSRDGSLITAFIGGTRLRKKLNRRLNIYTKNPQLTTPAE